MSTNLFDQYATLDPAETPEALPDWTSVAPVLLAEIDERTHPMQANHRPNTTTEPRRRWTGVLVAGAAFALVLIVGVSLVLLNRGGDSLDVIAPATTSTAAAATTVPPPTTLTTVALPAAVVVPDVWDPILGETRAKAAPPAATCPAGTDPNTAGPVDQARPAPGPWSNQAAVFDLRAGRIVYVDEAGETWTFDVCTNTWQQMNPELVPATAGSWRNSRGEPNGLPGELVYDVDSDRTIAFGLDVMAVYDAKANLWMQRSAPPDLDLGLGSPGLGAVYDPFSGLVVLQTFYDGLVTYDVDTDQWAPLGTMRCSPFMVYDPDTDEWTPAEAVEGCSPQLIGYSAETDRLIFVTFQGDGQLVDPRSGASTHLDGPPSGAGGGFGRFSYGTGGETAYTFGGDSICRLDPVTFDWACMSMSETGGPSMDHGKGPSAMVVDPINDRLLLIRDTCCNWPGSVTTDDVWAIDFDTGEWTQLLELLRRG